jgi:hypothetical protein
MGDDNPAYSPTSITGRETATQENRLQYASTETLVTSGAVVDRTVEPLNSNTPVSLEIVSMGVRDGYSEEIFYELSGTASGLNFVDLAVANQPNTPLIFDPGVFIDAGNGVRVRIANSSPSDYTIAVIFLYRPV